MSCPNFIVLQNVKVIQKSVRRTIITYHNIVACDYMIAHSSLQYLLRNYNSHYCCRLSNPTTKVWQQKYYYCLNKLQSFLSFNVLSLCYKLLNNTFISHKDLMLPIACTKVSRKAIHNGVKEKEEEGIEATKMRKF